MTIDDAYAQLWQAVNPTVALNPDSGLYKAWQAAYRDWGSPVADEYQADDGTPTQAFTHAIVQWTANGAEVVGE